MRALLNGLHRHRSWRTMSMMRTIFFIDISSRSLRCPRRHRTPIEVQRAVGRQMQLALENHRYGRSGGGPRLPHSRRTVNTTAVRCIKDSPESRPRVRLPARAAARRFRSPPIRSAARVSSSSVTPQCREGEERTKPERRVRWRRLGRVNSCVFGLLCRLSEMSTSREPTPDELTAYRKGGVPTGRNAGMGGEARSRRAVRRLAPRVLDGPQVFSMTHQVECMAILEGAEKRRRPTFLTSAHNVHCARYGRYLDAEMALSTSS
ncbi:hypothetical protein SALB_06938 [Streptomyces noursei]|uniref:Uncharacterized protein n=1 Tax=Streptomyces noursei TaxID=1971 RepID=A0A401R967_STRNR|nr:hypothetical protein SALB_06938 [Streptomyces noursei]